MEGSREEAGAATAKADSGAATVQERVERTTAVGDKGAPAQHQMQLNRSSARQRLLLTRTSFFKCAGEVGHAATGLSAPNEDRYCPSAVADFPSAQRGAPVVRRVWPALSYDPGYLEDRVTERTTPSLDLTTRFRRRLKHAVLSGTSQRVAETRWLNLSSNTLGTCLRASC